MTKHADECFDIMQQYVLYRNVKFLLMFAILFPWTEVVQDCPKCLSHVLDDTSAYALKIYRMQEQ